MTLGFSQDVQVLSLKEYQENPFLFLKNLEKALDKHGYFLLEGFDLDPKLIDQAYAEAHLFFNQEEKTACRAPIGTRGYVPGESPKGESRHDHKEFFHIGRELSKSDYERLRYLPNVWPNSPSNFRKTMLSLYQELDRCKNTLGEAFSELLDQKKSFLANMVKEGDCLLRIAHYPAKPPKEVYWAGKHTDINLFTLYPPATSQGLEIQQKNGTWTAVTIPKGHILVHCGELMENLSNGLIKATVHQARDPGLGHDRYSIMFFVHPRSDDRLDPLATCIEKTGGKPLYPPASHLELLFERLIDLGLANDEIMTTFVELGIIEKLKNCGRFSKDAEKTLIEKNLISPPEQPSSQS